jgi:hypothetical protein
MGHGVRSQESESRIQEKSNYHCFFYWLLDFLIADCRFKVVDLRIKTWTRCWSDCVQPFLLDIKPCLPP